MKFINVRGCNGSGKTSVLRSLAKRSGTALTLRLSPPFPASEQSPPHDPIPFTFSDDGVAILGDYRPPQPGTKEATTAGCDRVKTQAATKAALEWAAAQPGVWVVLFEGVVVSTIYGPWKEWAEAQGGMAWAFLDTPLATCLERIQKRNGGKPIQEDQVADKHRTIARVRGKALADGLVVADLHWQTALTDLRTVLADVRPAEDF